MRLLLLKINKCLRERYYQTVVLDAIRHRGWPGLYCIIIGISISISISISSIILLYIAPKCVWQHVSAYSYDRRSFCFFNRVNENKDHNILSRTLRI